MEFSLASSRDFICKIFHKNGFWFLLKIQDMTLKDYDNFPPSALRFYDCSWSKISLTAMQWFLNEHRRSRGWTAKCANAHLHNVFQVESPKKRDDTKNNWTTNNNNNLASRKFITWNAHSLQSRIGWKMEKIYKWTLHKKFIAVDVNYFSDAFQNKEADTRRIVNESERAML